MVQEIIRCAKYRFTTSRPQPYDDEGFAELVVDETRRAIARGEYQ
jgi:hypothetical protein